jgi:hypothetical protein
VRSDFASETVLFGRSLRFPRQLNKSNFMLHYCTDCNKISYWDGGEGWGVLVGNPVCCTLFVRCHQKFAFTN